MTNPTFVLVPGAWHSPHAYDPTAALLKAQGYTVVLQPLHSVGAQPPDPSFDNNVKGIRETLVGLIEEESDIVLVFHSYSGSPGQEACKDLAKADR